MAQISLEKANALIEAALAEGKKRDFMKLAVVVLDPGGHLIAAQREDGAAIGRPATADAKAYAALFFGLGSGWWGTHMPERVHFLAGIGNAAGGRFVPVPGGVVIKDGEEIVGAVGISGDVSDNDQICAIAGIEAVGLTAFAAS
jgi:uncharacterized protein GlcG (DUF336 family)